jgi:aminoglycoside/choline kinase family phosphotransferase
MPQASPEYRKAQDHRPHHHRFARSNTAMGVMRWVKMAGILAPLVIGEL